MSWILVMPFKSWFSLEFHPFLHFQKSWRGLFSYNLYNFHKQALLAWKSAFLSLKVLLWNKCDILVRNKSLFFPKRYESHSSSFWWKKKRPTRKVNLVICAIPHGLIQFVIEHVTYNDNLFLQSFLKLDRVDLTDKKCKNKHIRQFFQTINKVFFFRCHVDNIYWRRAWLLLYNFKMVCIK